VLKAILRVDWINKNTRATQEAALLVAAVNFGQARHTYTLAASALLRTAFISSAAMRRPAPAPAVAAAAAVIRDKALPTASTALAAVTGGDAFSSLADDPFSHQMAQAEQRKAVFKEYMARHQASIVLMHTTGQLGGIGCTAFLHCLLLLAVVLVLIITTPAALNR